MDLPLANPAEESTTAFGQLVAYHRGRAGLSQRQVAASIPCSHQYIAAIESGARWPDQAIADALDATLTARSAITRAWSATRQLRVWHGMIVRDIRASVQDSLKLTTAEDEGQWPDLTAHALMLAESFNRVEPGDMLRQAMDARAIMLTRLQSPSSDSAKALRALAVIQGVLAFAAMDLGHPDAALIHAKAAESLATQAQDRALRAWVATCRSATHRLRHDYASAITSDEQGLAVGSIRGTTRARLWSGLAKSRANLGDIAGSKEALDEAARELDAVTEPDEFGGIFSFTRSSQQSYIVTAMRLSPDSNDITRALDAARTSLEILSRPASGVVSVRSVQMCRSHQVPAFVAAGDLGGAAAAAAPLLALPLAERTAWIARDLHEVATTLASGRWADSTEARELRELLTSPAPIQL